MERVTLAVSYDVIKPTVSRAAVYGHDSGGLLTIRLPPDLTVAGRLSLRWRVCVLECVCM